MALTRANVESILIRRVGTLFGEAGLDGTTVDGSNADLNDPIGYALRKLEYSVADATSVADGDLDDVGSGDYDALFDLAELRGMESCYSALLTLVTTTVGPRTEVLSDMAKGLKEAIAWKRKQVEEEYDVGVGTLEAGIVELDFVEKGE